MAWQRRVLPVVQHDLLARLPHRHEAGLGHLPTRPHEPQPRPQAHGLRLARCSSSTAPSRASRRFSRSLMAIRWACEITAGGYGQHSVPRAAQKEGSIPFPKAPLAGDGESGTEAWRGWQGFGAPPFLGGPPMPCGLAQSFVGGPSEPDNRRLALKQSDNLHFAGPTARRERSSPEDHSSEPHGPTCPNRIE